jgi:hypothetical protein
MSQKIAKVINKPKTIQEKIPVNTNSINTNSIRPILPNSLVEYFNYTSQQNSYTLQAFLLASCEINFYNASKNIDLKKQIIEKIYIDEMDTNINWDDSEILQDLNFSKNEKINSSFCNLPAFLQNSNKIKLMQKDFINRVYKNSQLTLYKNNQLKIISKQNETLTEFKIRLKDKLNEKTDLDIEELQEKYIKEKSKLQDKLNRLYIKLEKEKDQASSKTTDTLISIGTSILGAFFGRSAFTKTNMTKAANSAKNVSKVLKERKDIEFVEIEIEEINTDISNLKEKLEDEIFNIKTQNDIVNFEIEEVTIKLRRKDIYNVELSILWEEI